MKNADRARFGVPNRESQPETLGQWEKPTKHATIDECREYEKVAHEKNQQRLGDRPRTMSE